MNKQCKKCYWLSTNGEECLHCKNVNSKNCDEFMQKCDNCYNKALYKYNGKELCFNCLMKELEVETETVENYYLDGYYIGNDGDIDEVIENLKGDYDIEELEE